MSKQSEYRNSWFKIIKKWQESGLTQAQFCRDKKYNQGTFSKWKLIFEFKKDHEFNKSSKLSKPEAQAIKFLPVSVKPEYPITNNYSASVIAKVQFNQTAITIFKGADFETLMALFKAMGI